MANPCVYTYKGKDYTYDEFATLMHDGELANLSNSGAIKGDFLNSMPKELTSVKETVSDTPIAPKENDEVILDLKIAKKTPEKFVVDKISELKKEISSVKRYISNAKKTGKNLDFIQVWESSIADANSKIEFLKNEKQASIDKSMYSSEKDENGNNLSKKYSKELKDTKVRNEKGQIIPVYHGTNSEFDVFDKTKRSNYSSGAFDIGNYGYNFSSNIEVAKSFQGGVKGQVKEVYLDIKNPLILNYKELIGKRQSEVKDMVDKKLKEGEYDGIIIKNANEKGFLGDNYIVFDSKQIRNSFDDSTIEQINETQTQGDVVADGNIRPTTEQVGEVAVTEQPTAKVTETKVVEPTVEPRASKGFTDAKVINRDYAKIKAKLGDKKAKQYFDQVDKLFDPNNTEVVEYRTNGVVTKQGEDFVFNALSGMDTKNWRIAFSSNINEQFTEPTRKEIRIKATEAKIDEIANSIKGLESVFGIKIKADTNGENIQGTSRDQLIDFIAKTAKEIAKTGITIDEAIRSVISELKKSYDVDIEIDEVKKVAEPAQEPRETFIAEKGKHSVLLRLSKGDNPQREIDAINRADFDYDVRNQEKVNREAENFVKDVGISQAYKALKEGKIEKFDTVALIYNAILQQMPKDHDALISEMTNEDDIMRAEEAYANEFAQVSKDFSVFETRMGQGISVMNYIYNKNENIRYELSRQKEAYKASNNGVIPQDVLEKYDKASKRLEEVNKLIKEKEVELAEIENTVLVQEIEKSIKRQKQTAQKSKTSLSETELKRKRQLSKKFFRANDITSFATILLDPEFREYLGLSFKEAKGDLEAFTKRVLKEIGNAYKPHISEMFDVANEANEQSQANSIKLSKDGRITVPKSVVENLIERGFDNINSISEEVLRIMKEKHPELTLRQVKESIVGYGRDVSKTRTDIEIEIGRLKRIGQLELEIEDLENGIVKVKNEKKQIQQSSKIQDLRARKRQLEDELGITEEKRTERTKGYAKRRIAELKKRISEGDFAKKEVKPVKQDAELRRLRMEKIELQEIFDKERYKLELKNRSKARKLFDSMFDILNIKRVGLTTGEFSPMFVQGGALTVRNILRNPKQFLADLKTMMKSIASTEYYKQTEQDIKSSDIFDIIRDAKLGIVETDTKQSAKEELFQHQILESVFDYGAEQVVKLIKPQLTEKYGEKRAEEIANNIEKITKEYVLILRPFERANNAYMNSLRYNRFKEGVEMLQAEGKNPIDNLEDYKRVASAINTLTGRSNLGALEQYKQGLGLIFFSAKLMASTWQKVNPMHYWALRDSENWKKPSVAQKMLFVDALTHYAFMASVTLLMKAAYNAIKDDDEEEATVEIDPRSSDFMKFKVGNARLDYFGTGLAPFVLFSRLYTEEVMKADGQVYKMGESGTKSRGEYVGNYFVNKLNPLTAGVYKYANTTKKEFEGETFREDDWGRDFDYVDYMTDIMPIIYGTGKEVLEEQPNLFGGLIMLQAAFGVNPSVYGNEDKGIKNEPDLDEQGNPREKSNFRQRPTRPSMPKRPERP